MPGAVSGYALPLMSQYVATYRWMSDVSGAALKAGSIVLRTSTASTSYPVVGVSYACPAVPDRTISAPNSPIACCRPASPPLRYRYTPGALAVKVRLTLKPTGAVSGPALTDTPGMSNDSVCAGTAGSALITLIVTT